METMETMAKMETMARTGARKAGRRVERAKEEQQK
jgi:hypothetical protein